MEKSASFMKSHINNESNGISLISSISALVTITILEKSKPVKWVKGCLEPRSSPALPRASHLQISLPHYKHTNTLFLSLELF